MSFKGVIVITRIKRIVVSTVSSLLLLGGVMAPSALAQQQDGLINVMVGDVTIEDAVDIGVAAQVAAEICGVKVGPVAVLGAAVDRSGESRTVCQTDQGDVTLTQN